MNLSLLRGWRLAAILCLTVWGAGSFGQAEDLPRRADLDDSAAEPAFLRVRRDDRKKVIGLDTAIVRYRLKDAAEDSPTVDLIGAVHIGDKAYYEALNQRFEQYDALLFELVAPHDAQVPKGGAGANRSGIGQLQSGMKDLLNLEYQLEQIDYTKENFVHADMSPEEFAEAQEKRGEDLLSLLARALAQGIMQQQQPAPGGPSDFDLLRALLTGDSLAMKRIFAAQFENSEAAMAAFEGPDGSTIISDRNQVALDVLLEQLKAGKKKLGIFYGAAHLPDMQLRLAQDFDLHPVETEWVAAWDMQEKPRANRRSRRSPRPAPAE